MDDIDDLPSYRALLARTDAPAGSTWGLLGDLGTLALLGPATARRGAGAVRTGRTFRLDLALDALEPNVAPHRTSPRHVIFSRHPSTRDDYVDGLYLQGSSQVDGLRHFRHWRHGFYNGVADEEVSSGSRRLGVGQWAERGLAGRGVLIDLVRAGIGPVDRSAWHAYTPSDLDRALEAQGLHPEPGDALLLRTGWLGTVLAQDRAARERLRADNASPGLEQSHDMVEWLWDRGFSLVAADNLSVECLPPLPSSPFAPVAGEDADVAYPGLMHHVLIPLMGFALGELWHLDDLADACAEEGRWDFLLTVSPLALTGGVGSPPNATAVL